MWLLGDISLLSAVQVGLLHSMQVSLAQGGSGMGASMGTQIATSLLQEASFKQVRMKRVQEDPTNIMYVATKP